MVDSSSSDDDSIDDDREKHNQSSDSTDLILAMLRKDHPKQTGYLNVVSKYSNRDFWCHFRVTRSTFDVIIHFLISVQFRSHVTFHGGVDPRQNTQRSLRPYLRFDSYFRDRFYIVPIEDVPKDFKKFSGVRLLSRVKVSNFK